MKPPTPREAAAAAVKLGDVETSRILRGKELSEAHPRHLTMLVARAEMSGSLNPRQFKSKGEVTGHPDIDYGDITGKDIDWGPELRARTKVEHHGIGPKGSGMSKKICTSCGKPAVNHVYFHPTGSSEGTVTANPRCEEHTPRGHKNVKTIRKMK